MNVMTFLGLSYIHGKTMRGCPGGHSLVTRTLATLKPGGTQGLIPSD